VRFVRLSFGFGVGLCALGFLLLGIAFGSPARLLDFLPLLVSGGCVVISFCEAARSLWGLLGAVVFCVSVWICWVGVYGGLAASGSFVIFVLFALALKPESVELR
jgi:hypothetical protein